MRVVAGELRGRRLSSVLGRETRPTSDRARAGVFDWLRDRVSGARVLDLFAGTGALGVEALSRGAREAVFVERARPALRVLRGNLAALGLESRARVVERDLSRGLGALVGDGGVFELVFADPPYQGDWLQRLVSCETLGQILGSGAVVIAERSARSAPVIPHAGAAALVLRGSKRYGETAFDWYEVPGAVGRGESET